MHVTWRVVEVVPMVNERQLIIEVVDDSGAPYAMAAAVVRIDATQEEASAAIDASVRWAAAEERRRREAQDAILGLTGAVVVEQQ
jgi:ribosomal protein L14